MLPPRFGTNCPLTGIKNGGAQHGLRSFIYSARGLAPRSVRTAGPGSWGCGILCKPVQGVAGPAPGMREKGSKRKGTRPARSEFRLPLSSAGGARGSVSGPPRPRGRTGTHLEASGKGFRLALLASGSRRCTQRASDWGKDN